MSEVLFSPELAAAAAELLRREGYDPRPCAFCPGVLGIVQVPLTLMHTTPTCETFRRLGVEAFLDACLAKQKERCQ